MQIIKKCINIILLKHTMSKYVLQRSTLIQREIYCDRNRFGSLSDEEKELINTRYMKDLTQSETADIMGISQVQVSRIEKKVLEKMKLKLEAV